MRTHTLFNATVIGLLLTASNLLAASTTKGVIIRGFILANEEGGQPIANVQVTAIEGANPVSSNSDGTFALEFKDKQPGDKVQLNVVRTGMVVVNYHQLGFLLPRAADAAPLILLLCRADEREEMTARFYEPHRLDSIERRYRKKLEDLQAKKQATEAAKEQLRIERDQAREAERTAAEKLARVKAGEVSDFYGNGISPVYRSDAAMALNSVATIDRRENRMEEARTEYDKALEISRKLARLDLATYLPDVIQTLNNLGNMLSDQSRIEEAKETYGEALELGRTLERKKSPTLEAPNVIHLPIVAMTLNNLGILLQKQKRTDEARSILLEALERYRELAPAHPSTYLPYVAEILNKLGILYVDKDQAALALDERYRRRKEKREAFSDALIIYETLERRNPGQYGQEIETTRRLLEADLNEALESYREQAKLYPGYRPNVAEILNNLGILNRDHNRIVEALKSFSEAFGIYVTLVHESLDQYGQLALEINGTIARMNPGQYQREFESNGRALKAAFEERLKSYREKAQLNPNYLSNVAKTLISLGTLTRDQNRMAEARNHFSEALRIFDALAKNNPPPKGGDHGPYDGDVKSTKRLLEDLTEIQKP